MNRSVTWALACAAFILGCTGCATGQMGAIASAGEFERLLELARTGDVERCDRCPSGGPLATPIACAARFGHVDAVRVLLDRGAGTTRSCGYRSPLAFAAEEGHLSVAKLLIEHGARIDDNNPEFPLGLAIKNNRVDMVKLLLDAGANPAVQIHRPGLGGLPWSHDYAKAKGYTEIVELLRAARLQGRPRRPRPAVAAAEPARVVEPPAAAASTEPGSGDARTVDKPSYRMPSRPNDLALVIGIERYSKLPDAPFAERDSEAVRNHLLALGVPPRNAVHLVGSNATRSAIQGYVEEWLPRNVKPDSTVFFFYSGHGAPDPQTGEAYLVPWDGNASFLQSTAYPLRGLSDKLAKLGARSVLVALDSCFSGAGGRSVLPQGARPLVAKVAEGLPAGRGVTLLAAASGEEMSSTIDEARHGLFTYFMLKGLNGDAKDPSGRVTLRGLYDYLKPKVQDEARLQNREQTPALFGEQTDIGLVQP